MNEKEQLLELVEAFAAARTSGNIRLQQHAAADLGSFLQSVTITADAEDVPTTACSMPAAFAANDTDTLPAEG